MSDYRAASAGKTRIRSMLIAAGIACALASPAMAQRIQPPPAAAAQTEPTPTLHDLAFQNFKLGFSAQVKGDCDEAIQRYSLTLTMAAALAPNDVAQTYYQRAGCYDQKDQLDAAVADIGQGLGVAADRRLKASLYALRGSIRIKDGSYKKAMADENTAIEMEPGQAVNYSNRAVIRYAEFDLQGARADCETALRLDPKIACAAKFLEEIKRELADAAAGREPVVSRTPTPDDLLIIFNPAAHSSHVTKDLSGAVRIDPAQRINNDICILQQWQEAAERNDPPLDGYQDFIRAEFAKRLPGLDGLRTGFNGCTERPFPAFDAKQWLDNHALYIFPRHAVSRIPQGFEVLDVVPWSAFLRYKAQKAEQAKIAAKAAADNLAAIVNGSLDGVGLLIVSDRTDVCVETRGADAAQRVFLREANKIRNAPFPGNFVAEDRGAIFVSLKSGQCGSFFGSADAIKVLVPALTRDQRTARLDDRYWLTQDEFMKIDAEAAAEEIKQAAERRARAEMAAAAERAEVASSPYTAILSCDFRGSPMILSACLGKGPDGAGHGSLEITTDGAHRAYTILDIDGEFGAPRKMLPLSEHFDIIAQGSGSDFLRLTLKIVDSDGNVKFQRQAVGFDAIKVAN